MLEPQEKSKLGASITSIIQYNINKSLKFIYNNVDRYLKFNSMVLPVPVYLQNLTWILDEIS